MENTGRTLLVIVAVALGLQVAYHYATLGALAGGDSHYPAPQTLAREAGLLPAPRPKPPAPSAPAPAPAPLAAVALVQPLPAPAQPKPPVKLGRPKPAHIQHAGDLAPPTPAPDEIRPAPAHDDATAQPQPAPTSATSQIPPY